MEAPIFLSAYLSAALENAGAALVRYASIVPVNTASARPKIVRCPAIIAGMEMERGYGQYKACPSSLVNSRGWMPNSMAAARLLH